MSVSNIIRFVVAILSVLTITMAAPVTKKEHMNLWNVGTKTYINKNTATANQGSVAVIENNQGSISIVDKPENIAQEAVDHVKVSYGGRHW
jgi:hypothetical protein